LCSAVHGLIKYPFFLLREHAAMKELSESTVAMQNNHPWPDLQRLSRHILWLSQVQS